MSDAIQGGFVLYSINQPAGQLWTRESSMKSLWPIIALAALWAVTGAVVGLGLSSLYGVNWIMPCGLLNMIAGLILLLLVTRDETARRIFYEGPSHERERSLAVAILWALPVAAALAGVIWWLLGKVLPP